MYWQIIAALTLMTMFALMAWLIVHARTESVYRPLALLAFFSGIPATVFAFTFTLGTAIPSSLPMFSMPDGTHTILGHKSVPKVGIFVLLDSGDHSAPMYYALPWDKDTSERLESDDGNNKLKVISRKTGGPNGLWDFTWNQKEAIVTKESPPQIQFTPKNNPDDGPAVRVLPPAQ